MGLMSSRSLNISARNARKAPAELPIVTVSVLTLMSKHPENDVNDAGRRSEKEPIFWLVINLIVPTSLPTKKNIYNAP